jgi:hypothetical protein
MRLGASVSNTPGYVKTFYCTYPDDQKSGAALRCLLMVNATYPVLRSPPYASFRDQRLILRGVRRYSAAL